MNGIQDRFKWLAAAVLAGVPFAASATGFRLPDQDAFATARGEAFAATADNPSAIYYNPAGITQLEGANVRGGVYGLNLDLSYEGAGGRKFSSEKDLHAVPQFFFTYTPTNFPISFGLGAYAPFGLSSSWPDDSGFRTLGTDATLSYYTINPVLAWKVSDTLSFGAGARFNYSKIDLRQGLFSPNQPVDEFRFKGDGWDIGYNIGVLWKAHEKLSFGVSFRSSTTVEFEGHTSGHNDVAYPGLGIPQFGYTSDARAEVPFPLSVVAGVSFRPTEKWNLEFNADYNGWNRINTVVVEQSTTFPVIPLNVPIVLNWEDSWYYEFGATRYFDNGWTVSAGYILNENSVPEANFTPLVPDQDRHFFSVGTGYTGANFNFDLAYQYGYGPGRDVTGPVNPLNGNSITGEYAFESHAILLSAGWHF
jgi:long-chain fatty acid transport protein